MDFGIYAGDTDKTIYVLLRDSTTGLAKTGLVFNSAGAVCSYVLPGAARAAIALATQTVTGAHADGGFVEVDATNCKGLYRLDLPDAAIASGAYTLISIEFDGIIEETVLIPLHLRKVNVTQLNGGAQSLLDLKDFADDGYDPATNKVQGVVLTDTVTTYTGNTPQTGDAFARLGAPAGASVSADIAAVKVDTAAILLDTGTDGVVVAAASKTGYSLAITGMDSVTLPANILTASALAADAVTKIQSGLATSAALATVDTNVDTLLARITSTLFSGITSLAQWLGLLAGKQTGNATALTEIKGTGAGAGTYDPANDSQEAIRDRGDTAWITATSVTVSDKNGFSLAATGLDLVTAWTVDIAGSVSSVTGAVGSVTAGVTVATNNDKAGYSLVAAYDPAKTAAQASDIDAALVAIHLDHLLAVDYDPATKPGVATALFNELIESNAGVSRFTAAALAQAPSGGSAAAIADAVWEEVAADHNTAGTMGQKLNAAGGAADPLTNAVPGAYGSGTAGEALGFLDDIKAKTDTIGSGNVTVVSPVNADGSTITVVRGDDYKDADGRAFSFSSTDWPDLTGATLTFTATRGSSSVVGSVTGTAVGGATQTVKVELDAADTALLEIAFPANPYGWDIQATLASANVVTLANGDMIVTEDYS